MSTEKICIQLIYDTFNLRGNGNTSGVLSVQPIFDTPYVTPIRILHNNWMCGPIIAIIKELLLKENLSIEIKKEPYSTMEFVEGLVTDPPQVVLMSTTASQVVVYQQRFSEFGITGLLDYSVNVDYFEIGNIAYRINSGSLPFLGYLSCFQTQVWLFILLSIIALSLFSTIHCKNCFDFVKNFWTFYVLLFSKTISLKSMSTDLSQTIALSSWLTSTLVLSIYFSGNVMDFMVKAIPKSVIDSWDDLYRRPDIRIMASSDSPFAQFAKRQDSEMAKNFNQRIDEFSWEEMYNESEKIYTNLKSGRKAFVRKRLSLIYVVKKFFGFHDNIDNIFDQIYISRDSGGFIPYFIPVTKEITPKLKSKLDDMVLITRESGLFSVWTKQIYPLVNLTERADQKITKDIYQYKDISLESLADVFILMAFSVAVVFTAFILELIYSLNLVERKPIVKRRRGFTTFYTKSFKEIF